MKIQIIFLASLILIFGLILSGCDSSAKKVADARENVNEAKNDVSDAEHDLYVAKQDSSEEYQTFKRESEDRITKLDNKIAELKLKLSKEKRNNKNETLLKDYEQKTAQMKKELIEYKEDKVNDWKVFRDKFNRNMDELGHSISNFFTNTK